MMIINLQKEAEQHMPFLAMRGGLSIQMEDFDTGHSWNLRYRYGSFCFCTIFFSFRDHLVRSLYAGLGTVVYLFSVMRSFSPSSWLVVISIKCFLDGLLSPGVVVFCMGFPLIEDTRVDYWDIVLKGGLSIDSCTLQSSHVVLGLLVILSLHVKQSRVTYDLILKGLHIGSLGAS